jgi:2-polyprenyl-3-methyl-5-hydroxy-6-metoxy-1,4-benzoquinol methylase
MNKAHLTAISRKAPSAPMKYLHSAGLLNGKLLDYGCGKGFDADTFGMDKFDPFYFPNELQPNSFNTITCNYVLNVIENPVDREYVINQLLYLVKPEGTIFITVRADKKKLNGYTSKGTWQGFIELKYPILRQTANYITYILRK